MEGGRGFYLKKVRSSEFEGDGEKQLRLTPSFDPNAVDW